MKQLLSIEDVMAADAAASEFIRNHGDCGMSHETIMTMCFIKMTNAQNDNRPSGFSIGKSHAAATYATVPDWFAEGVKLLAGRRITASTALTAMGKPNDMKSLREAGAWLRQLCGEPYRSGGQTLFIVPAPEVANAVAAPLAKRGDVDVESPYAPGVPLASKAITFAIEHPEGRYTPLEIAHSLGHQGTNQEVIEIGRSLLNEGFPYDDGYYYMSKVR